MTTTQRIDLTVNGRVRSLDVAPHHTLLEAIRDDLGLTGTKACCLVGECGACTVLVDDVSVDACLMLAVEADGMSVTTVEGLANCIPGQLVSARALLARNPRPTRPEVEDGLAGNLCRCAGYGQIIEAVLVAAAAGSGE